MNKIFKVIWSKSKQCYVVVSEIAKNKTGKKKIVVASILAALAMQSGMITDVMAADPPSAKLADAALAVGTNGVAIGSSAKSQSNQSVAIGYFSNAQAPSASPENPATAVGAGANADGAGTVALGLSANATGANAIALGGGSNGGTNKTEATGKYAAAIGFNAKASQENAVALGPSATAAALNSIALGKGASITAPTTGTTLGGQDSIAMGTGASAKQHSSVSVGLGASSDGVRSVAIGPKASATDEDTIAIGTGGVGADKNNQATGANGTTVSNTTLNSVSGVNLYYGAKSSGKQSIAIGYIANAKESGIAFGNYAVSDGGGGTAMGKSVLSRNGGVVVGQSSNAIGKNSVAYGNTVKANGENSTAMGYSAIADGQNAVAVGYSNTASNKDSVAIGNTNQSTNQGSVTVGYGNNATNDNAVAIGRSTNASGLLSTAIGNGATSQGTYDVAIGSDVTANGNNSVAIGRNAKTSNTSSLAIGVYGTKGTSATGNYSIAMGRDVTASAESAIAIGKDAVADKKNAVAFGSGSDTSSAATAQSSTTIGGKTYSWNKGVLSGADLAGMQVSVGKTGFERQIKNVAAGEISANSTDAINGAQLYSVASGLAKDLKVPYVSIKSGATGSGSNVDNDGATGPNSIAIGPSSAAKNQDGVAFGNNAQSLSDYSIAIGTNAKAESGSGLTNASRAIAIGANSRVATNVTQGIAIGSGSVADEGAVVTGDQSIAIGGNVKVDGHAAVAIGGDDARKAAAQTVSYTSTNDVEVTGSLQTAIQNLTGYNLSKYQGTAAGHAGVAYGTSALAGNAGVAIGTASDSMTRKDDKGNTISNKPVTNAVAIGTGARANFDNSVAIGGGSNTDHYATKQVNAVIDGVEVKWSGGENISPGDVVSFGAKGFERQLKNVAPGEVSQTSTDAVNGSQIYSLARKVTNIMNGGSGSVVNVNATGEPLSKVVTGTGASKVEKYYRTVDVKDDGTLVTGAVAQTPTSLALVNVAQTDTNKQTQTPRILGNVANGVKDNDAVNVSQLNAAKVKYFSVNSSDAGNINNDGATGTDAIAIGPSATSNDVGSVALGKDAKANGAFTVALGGGNWQFKGAQANGVGTTALGSNTKTQENINYQTAIGFGATTSAESALALGYNAAASAQNAIALGRSASTAGQDAVALGSSSQAKGDSGLAIGNRAQANSNSVISLGYQANNGASNNANGVSIGWAAGMQSNGSSNVGIGSGAGRQISGNNNVSIGNGAGNIASANLYTSDSIMLGSEARAINGTASKAVSSVIAIGKKASGGADSAIALGQGASSTNQNSIAIGTNSQATAYNGVAIGAYSVANTAGGVAGFNPNTSRTDTYSGLTGRALTSTTGAVAIGSDSQSRQLTGLAAGTADTDAVNVAQLKSVNLAFKGNAGTGDVNLAAHPLTIQGNDNYITTSANGNTINISGKVQNITVTNGTATAANKGMADAQNVADAINNAVQSNAYKWKLTANGEATPETIAKDDTVDFSGDTNISVARNGKKITTSLKKDITVDSVKANKSITTGSGSNQITLDGTSGAVTGRTFSGQSFAAGDNVLSNTTLQIGSTTNVNNVTITKDGLTSKAGSTTAKFGATGIDAGGQRITNVSSGGNVGTNAANITDVKNAVSDITLKLDTNSKTGTVKLSDGSLKIVGANGIRTDLTGTNKDNLVIGLDSNTVNATTKGIGLSGDSGTMLRKFLKDGDADFKISGDGGLVTTSGTTTGVQVSVDKSKVKDLAVEAVTVSKATNILDNPITVTPTAGTNSKEYAIGIDTTKLAAKTNLAYTANGGTAKTVSLAKGLNFVNGTNTVATVDSDGKVSFDINKDTKDSINKSATAVGRTITLNADSGTGSSQSLSNGNVSFAVSGVTGDYISTTMDGSAVKVSTKRATINSDANTGAASVTGADGLATAKNVASAINSAVNGLSQNLNISDGTNNSSVALKNQKLTVTGTGAAKATVNGQTITIDVAEGTLTPNTTNGTVTGTTGVAKATEVAAAINNTNTVLGNKITKNTQDIATNTSNITANKNQITTNTTNIATNTANIAHTIALADDNGASTTAKSLKDGNVSFNIKGDNKFISTAASGNDVTLTVDEQAIKDAAKSASSFKVKANTHAEEEIKGGDTIAFNNGDNIEISQTGKTFTIGTAKNITVDSVTAGNTVINTSGLTNGTTAITGTGITTDKVTVGGLSIDKTAGINAGGKVISNVASGGTTDSNAANIGDVKQAVASLSQNLNITDGTNNGTVDLKNQKLNVAGANGVTATVNNQTITVGLDADTVNATTKGIGLTGDSGSTGNKYLKDGDVSFAVTGDGNLVSTSATAAGVKVAVDAAKVKDLAVAAVTVSKDTQADNPITVTPTAGANSKDYAIGIDTTKLAAKTDLTYRANSAADANAKKVSLSKGLNFVDGDSTVATVDNDGKVSFDLNTATKNQITTNTTDIAANKGKIATNTTNIAANTTALARNISLGADTGTASSQSLSAADVAFNVKGVTGDFVSTNMNGNTVEISTKRATINSNATTGEASVTGNDGLATAQNVADAINKAADAAKAGAAWNITTNSSTTDKTAVKGGDTVDLVNGDNIEITQDGTDKKKITVATKKDITVDSVTANNKVTVGSGANKITLDGTDGSVTGKAFTGTTFTGTSFTGTSFTAGNTVINTNGLTNGTTAITGTGVTTDNVTVGGISIDKTAGINAGNKVISNVASGGTTLTNAANIGDVQNAVANLSQNLNITDGTHDGTVDLKNQKLNVAGANGVTATVNNQTITVGLDADTVNATTKGIGLTADTGSTGNKYLKDGDVSFAVTGDGSLVSTSATAAGVKVAVNSATITAGTDGTITGPTTDGVATAKNVADAINAAKKASKTEITANTGEAANTTTGNVTLTSTTAADGHTIYDVKLNDKVTLGTGANAVTIDGTTGAITGKTATIGGVTVNGTANTIGGLSNTTWNGTAVSGRAATEDQLKAATGATTLKFTGDVAANTGSVNLKDDTFGIKGDGKYISTDVNGKNVNLTVSEAEVKKSAVAAVTVSTDTTDANNPLTVTPTTSADGTTKDYKVTIDGTKIANKTNLSYKANDGTAKQVSLAYGLNFKNGTLTTASIDDNGVVKYDVNTASITAGADGTITGPTTDGVATAQNVADAINAAKKASKTEVTANTGEAANATTGNVTLTSTTAADGHTIYDVKLNDKVTLGSGANAVIIDGTTGAITGKTANIGGVTVNGTANTIGGLSNTTWNGTATTGRAATEDQLKAVADAAGSQTWEITADKKAGTSGAQTGTKENAKVGKDDKVSLIAGENLTVDQAGKNFTYSLNTDLVKMNSATFLGTGTNTTVITGDSITQTAGTQTNTSTAAGNTVADGTKSTETTADGQVIKDGTKSNKSTVDNNVIDDGNGNVNTSNATSNTVTDGTNTTEATASTLTVKDNAGNSTVITKDNVTTGVDANKITLDGTAGKATIGSSIIDGVNKTFTTGGANAVTMDGAAGTIKTGTVTVTGGTTNDITGLSNTTVNSADFATKGRAATEEQLKAVGEQTWQITADKKTGTSGVQAGLKENAKVGKDDKVSLIAGENLTVDQAGKNFTYSLNTDLVKMNSATFLGTGTNTTVITGDSITQTAGTQTNTSTAAGNTVADGTKSTETTAAGQVIKDGTKTNTSTVDENTIVDGTKSNKSTVDGNTITDGTNTIETTSSSVTVKDNAGNSTLITKDNITTGVGGNKITLDGTAGKATIGSSIVDGVNNTFTTGGASPVTLNGATGTITGKTANIGGVTVDGTNNHVMGLANKDWTPGVTQAVSGRAATEDQLQKVSDAVGAGWKVNTGKVTGSTGESNGAASTKVASGEEVQFQAGNNLIVDQNGKTVAYSLNKVLKDLESATFNGTGTNTTVITGDSITQTAGTQTNTSTAAGNTVADGTKSTKTTADGQVIKDGTKTNTSTVDENTLVDGTKSNKTTVDSNVIDDGNGNVNTSNATSNTITDGTNTTATTSSSVTVKDNAGNSTVITKDNVTTGVGANKITLDGTAGTIKTGTVTVTGGTTNDITGLSNTTVTATDFATKGRAATEEQLKAVGEQTWQITAGKDTATSGAQTGTKKDAKVGKDDKVQLIAGENMTVNQNERDFTFTLNKDLVKMNSATFLGTGTNTTVITGDSITQTAGTQTNTSTAGGNTVADGTKSTETTADGQVIKDGAKSNKSTVDKNVIDDGNGNVNTSNATSNTVTDGTNTSTIIAGKATIGSAIVDGVNNTFTTGGASPVTLNGATGIITGKTANIGGVTVDGTNNHVMGLANKDWTPGVTQAVSGRAATEDQLQKVSDAVGAGWKVNTSKVTGSTGESNGAASTKVASGEEVQFQAGNNLIVDQNGKTVAYSLNKTLKDLESATFLGTGTNKTVITGDSITQTAGTQTNTSTAGGNTVADGTKSTETTAAGQVIKDGAKSNKSTVDNNVIDDGNGNVNTSNATSNTITDGTNTTEATASTLTVKDNAGNSTVITKDNITTGVGANKITLDGTAGKAAIGSSIIDGVNNTFTTGGTNAVKLDGAVGTIKTGNVTVTGGTTNDITGLSNTTVNSADFATKGRAATEEQLKAVGEQTWQITADKKTGTSGAQTGTKKDAKVGKDDKVQLIAGENMTVNQNERDFTFTLNKDLVKMNSATFLGTGSNTTVITGDSITQTAGTQTNTSTAGGNTVADGTKSTETTAAGQVIKDGTKTNTFTVDENTIVDGTKSNKSTVDGNSITDGTNTTETTSSSITVKDNAGNSTVITKDNITTGVGGNKIILDGTAGKATIGSSIIDGVNKTFTTGGANAVTMDGAAGTIKTGTVTVTGGTTNDITGLSNTTVNAADFATKGRAATEEQLKAVGEQTWQITADKDTATSGAQTGTKKDAKVGKDDKVQLIAGENMTINQNERDFTFTLNKDLVKMNSATFLGTGSNTTVITGNSIIQTAGTQTNTSTAGGNTVTDGTKSTETTAAGQVIKDGAKSNKSTVDSNVIDDGNGNKNTSNATSNTITDGTNTSTITAGKANIGNIAVDGVNNKITMGNGATPVTLDGANGHLDGLTNTTWVPGVTKATTGRAATEDQLQQVSDAVGAGWKVNTGTVAGSSGVSNGAASTKVSSGEEVKLQAGDNLVIDQNGKTVSYSLNKDLTKMNSATFEATGGKTTVIKGDSIVQTDGGKTNTSNAAGNTVADGTKSTATTAAGTTITDGAKTNTSTADKNVINDGVGNTNTSTATSNTLKNASGDETKADAKGVTVKDAAGNNATFTKDGITITKTGKDTVSLTSNGLDNGKNKIVNVAAGVANTDAVNVGQLKEYAAKSTTELTANNGETAGSTTGNIVLTKTTAADGHTIYNNKLNDKITLGTDPTKAVTVDGTTGTVTGLTNKTWTPGSIVSGRAATEDQLKDAVADSGWKVAVGKDGSGQSNVVGTSPEKIKAEETVTFKAGNNMMVTQTGKSISYAVNPELTNMTSATFTDTATGNTTVMNSNGITITPSGANPTNPYAGPVSLTKDGLNNGNNQIKGVAPGTDPTDAVNVAQLNASNANTSQAINQVAGEVQHVGAHAAAMAALKPIQYDPLEPTQVMAGVGNYRGETAAALGLAHYTNENTMFNVGVSVGGNHNMVNAGVTHKFGYSPEKKNIPDRYKAGPISSVYVMQDEVSSLKKENAEQKYVIADQAARLTTLEAENEQQRRELEETKKGLDDLKAAVDKLLASKG